MTKKEVEKKFPFSGKDGECVDCAYVDVCNKILPGFNKPGKCGGPFYKEGDDEIVKISGDDLRKMIAESIADVFGGGIDIGQELQRFLQDNKYKLFNKGWGNSQPTKRDYLIAKYFYELGKGEQENDE